MERMKRMPIGVDDFKDVMDRELYYVDKSLLIRELLDDGAAVNLFARPRRFGKTLNLSMLRYFFEKTDVDHSGLFQGLYIWQQGERYRREQGKYPVIALTFKGAKFDNWDDNYEMICKVIAHEYSRHQAVCDRGPLTERDRAEFRRIAEGSGSRTDYGYSLAFLSRALHAHYGEKVILLLDEYDTLLNEAYVRGFYDEAIAFLRVLLGEGFKNNIYLRKGVLTGIFRVARESIFSDLNNLKVSTVLSDEYRQYFGFTEEEMGRILRDFGLESAAEQVADWYNGYRFGRREPVTIYNPWSVAGYVDEREPRSYWVNTSGNAIVRKLVTEGGAKLQRRMHDLLERRPVEAGPIEESIVYGDLEHSDEAVWSFLLMSGYLTTVRLERRDDGELYGVLDVPNREVYAFFRTMLRAWFRDTVRGGDAGQLLKALTEGDIPTFRGMLAATVASVVSYHDIGGEKAESFYHAFVLGLLVHLEADYEVKSNRESGFGRYDVMVIPRDARKKGIVMEFKTARGNGTGEAEEETLEEAAAAALRQIEEKQYETELRGRGITDIVKLGIAFRGKQVKVAQEYPYTNS